MKSGGLGFCLTKHPSGVLCGRKHGHGDHRSGGDLEPEEHIAWDFTRTFGDPPRPGAPVVWVDEAPARSAGLDPTAVHRSARGEARAKGYTGDSCTSCGAMSMVRNGSCLKCVSCGETTGCS